MTEFKIKKWIKPESPECADYLEQIHEYLDRLFENPNYKLIESFREFTNSIAKDMKNVASGDVESLTVLTNAKDDKAFERAMSVLKSVDSFEKIAKITEDFKPMIEEIEKREALRITKGVNPMEDVVKKLRSKE